MALPKQMTREEYLSFERQSQEKHEYYRGEIFAMTGASRNHNVIVINVASSLHLQLRAHPCQVYPSDMRVKTRAPVLYTYPDVSVVCGTPIFEDEAIDTLLNPTVIVEVLSPSTEQYDRGRKFQHYRTLESLQEYLLVAQDTVRIEQFVRQGQTWFLNDASARTDVLILSSIGCTLALSDIYEKVSFDQQEESDS